MTYRQSSYDPLAATVAAPKRPYNAAQKLGVGFSVLAVLWLLAFTAVSAGLFGEREIPVQPGTAFAFIGFILINSRREEPRLLGEDERRRDRQWLLWTVAILAAGAGFILAVSGGK